MKRPIDSKNSSVPNFSREFIKQGLLNFSIGFGILIIFIIMVLGQSTAQQPFTKDQPIKGKILFDESHHQFWTACVDPAFMDYANELKKEGYLVDILAEGPITHDKLKDFDILVFPNGFVGKNSFDEGIKLLSDSEIEAIKDFVRAGGGLALFECGWSWVQYTGLSINEAPINQLGSIFGFTLNDDIIHDPTDFYGSLGDACPIFYRPFIRDHAITEGVSKISNCEGIPSSLDVYDSSVEVLITGDKDAFSSKYKPGTQPTFFAVTRYEKGKVVLFGQVGFLTSLDGNGDGAKNIYEFDNLRLGLNIMNWLSEPEVIPEESNPKINLLITDNSIVFGQVQLGVVGADSQNGLLAKIEYYIDDNLVFISQPRDQFPTSSYSWDSSTVSGGLHEVKAVGYDSEGRSTIDLVKIYVDNSVTNLLVIEGIVTDPRDSSKKVPISSLAQAVSNVRLEVHNPEEIRDRAVNLWKFDCILIPSDIYEDLIESSEEFEKASHDKNMLIYSDKNKGSSLF